MRAQQSQSLSRLSIHFLCLEAIASNGRPAYCLTLSKGSFQIDKLGWLVHLNSHVPRIVDFVAFDYVDEHGTKI